MIPFTKKKDSERERERDGVDYCRTERRERENMRILAGNSLLAKNSGAMFAAYVRIVGYVSLVDVCVVCVVLHMLLSSGVRARVYCV